MFEDNFLLSNDEFLKNQNSLIQGKLNGITT